jgi:hypothetical protein
MNSTKSVPRQAKDMYMPQCFSIASNRTNVKFSVNSDASTERLDVNPEKKVPSRPTSRAPTPVAVNMATDAQMLCKRLEEKIENLTKMGGQLQQDNKGRPVLGFSGIYVKYFPAFDS